MRNTMKRILSAAALLGAKVQATGESLYLGVIKQTGTCGFYRISVSEK